MTRLPQSLQGKRPDRPHSSNVNNFYYTKELFDDPRISIGDHTFGDLHIRYFLPDAKITIGRFCSIGAQVMLFPGGNHHTEWFSTYPFMSLPEVWPEAPKVPSHTAKGDIVIGNDVWIGSNSLILSGVTIGDGAVIGARAVVSRNVPPYTIVAGNPAKPVRKRFDDATIARLLALKWWDWPIEKIRAKLPALCSDNLNALLEEAEEKEAL